MIVKRDQKQSNPNKTRCCCRLRIKLASPIFELCSAWKFRLSGWLVENGQHNFERPIDQTMNGHTSELFIASRKPNFDPNRQSQRQFNEIQRRESFSVNDWMQVLHCKTSERIANAFKSQMFSSQKLKAKSAQTIRNKRVAVKRAQIAFLPFQQTKGWEKKVWTSFHASGQHRYRNGKRKKICLKGASWNHFYHFLKTNLTECFAIDWRKNDQMVTMSDQGRKGREMTW